MPSSHLIKKTTTIIQISQQDLHFCIPSPQNQASSPPALHLVIAPILTLIVAEINPSLMQDYSPMLCNTPPVMDDHRFKRKSCMKPTF